MLNPPAARQWQQAGSGSRTADTAQAAPTRRARTRFAAPPGRGFRQLAMAELKARTADTVTLSVLTAAERNLIRKHFKARS